MVDVHEKWLSVAELASRSDIPESTARRYLKRFDAYFRFEQRVKGRKYHPDSVQILKEISVYYENEFMAEDIEELLAKHYPITVTPVEETKEIESIRDNKTMATKEEMVLLVQEMQAMRQEIAAIQQSNEEIRNENALLHKQLSDRINERDHLLMETMRVLQEQRKEIAAAKEEKKSFWSRLFGK